MFIPKEIDAYHDCLFKQLFILTLLVCFNNHLMLAYFQREGSTKVYHVIYKRTHQETTNIRDYGIVSL